MWPRGVGFLLLRYQKTNFWPMWQVIREKSNMLPLFFLEQVRLDTSCTWSRLHHCVILNSCATNVQEIQFQCEGSLKASFSFYLATRYYFFYYQEHFIRIKARVRLALGVTLAWIQEGFPALKEINTQIRHKCSSVSFFTNLRTCQL